MIDPATGGIEKCTVPSARADLVSDQVDLSWLTHYPKQGNSGYKKRIPCGVQRIDS